MAWPGEKLLIRLWDTVEKSGVGLAQPWQLARVAKAEAAAVGHRMVVIAAAEQRIAFLRNRSAAPPQETMLLGNGESKSELDKVEPSFDFDLFSRQVTKAQTLEYLQKEVNIEKAIAHAESVLQNDSSEPPNLEVGPDWFFRWRDSASGVSSESLQQLWGNVLAGEIRSPGSFTYRTLDFLRSLSQDEAKLIEALTCTVIERIRIIYGKSWQPLAEPEKIPNQLGPPELALLEELGVVGGFSSMGYIDQAEPFHTTDGRNIHLLTCANRGLLLTTDDPKKVTGLGFYRLTKLGESLMQLVRVVPNEAYLWSLGELLARDGFKVELVDVIHNSNGTRNVKNSVPVPSPVSVTPQTSYGGDPLVP